jgi:putative acetyltransferase
MLIRRECPADIAAIDAVTAAAFGRRTEADLVAALRASDRWIPALSLVAVVAAADGAAWRCADGGLAVGEEIVVGHVVCSRGAIESGSAGAPVPALGLGPLSVDPARQRTGVGSALMHAVLGAADALDEPLVALLGSTGYYPRFGFRPADALGIASPDPAWGAHFQARALGAYDPALRGGFRYAPPFDDVD